ncbi:MULTISPECIES: hypothetical protein [Sphingobium]|uniref:hypothetical protein n=1 Tax=Sphingobium TaxID=165695 RepID=UPI000F0810C6|nr:MULTISPECIES: hypothetical protein [Sphingobium]
MTDRRAFLAGLTLAPAAIVIPAMAAAPATQDPAWLALLAAERSASAHFTAVAAEHDDAHDLLFWTRNTLTDAWDKERSEASNPGKFIDARPSSESQDERCAAGIRDFNANNARLRVEKAKIEERARQASGFADVDRLYEAASSRHRSAIAAVIAHPARDPDIIAAKLRLLIKEFGDETGDLGPLLSSITGEARA